MQGRSISALSVIRRGCRSTRRRMATVTATSASAIRMGLRTRMPMVIRRAIRCGVLADPFFSARRRDKFFSRQSTIVGQTEMSVPSFLLQLIRSQILLVANDGDSGFRNFQAHQAVIGVEQKKNLEVGRRDLEALEGFSVGACGARGLHGDGARSQFLGNENRKSLHATL